MEKLDKLDKIDLQILSALQKNAHQRLEDVAKQVKLATSSVHDRVRRLERDGVIRRWTIDVDPEAVGMGVLAFVGVHASRPCSEVSKLMKGIAAVEECYSVAGKLGAFLKVRVPTTSDLNKLLEQMRSIPGIEGTETMIVLKTELDRPISIERTL